jgi:hypothetical protein
MAQAPCPTALLTTYLTPGFSCTVADKTFSMFSVPQVTNVTGVADLVVMPITEPDPTNNNQILAGLVFSGNVVAGTGDGLGDVAIDFTVNSNTPILGATLNVTGNGSFCDNEHITFAGGTFVDLNAGSPGFQNCVSTADRKTFSATSLTVVNNISIAQGSSVTSIQKLFIEPTTTPTPPMTMTPPNDSEEPGSAIVFAKFLRGLVVVDGVSLPQTEIEVGIVCPHHTAADGTIVNEFCAEHQPVKIRFSWVCPAFQGIDSQICRQNNFDVFGSVNGKIVFDPENLTLTGSNSVNVATPPCPMGYLIGWVINPANDQPVKFDGLVGDQVIREAPNAVSAFNAIPIQAADEASSSFGTTPVVGTSVITTGTSVVGLPQLEFDGVIGHYKAVSHTIMGDVKFTNDPASAAFPIRSASFLTLLTLDVLSDFPNNPTLVNINWWNESNALSPNSPLSEKLLSTSLEFICWTEIPLTMIDPNLTASQMGTRKGVFRSTQATKVGFAGVADTTGPATLLGIVETLEGGVGGLVPPAPFTRSYFYPTFNNSDPVATSFQFE